MTLWLTTNLGVAGSSNPHLSKYLDNADPNTYVKYSTSLTYSTQTVNPQTGHTETLCIIVSERSTITFLTLGPEGKLHSFNNHASEVIYNNKGEILRAKWHDRGVLQHEEAVQDYLEWQGQLRPVRVATYAKNKKTNGEIIYVSSINVNYTYKA